MKLAELLLNESVSSVVPASLMEADVLGVTMDSRLAGPGIVFVACEGALPTSRDGHDFIAKAGEQGSSVIFAQREVEGMSVFVSEDTRALLARLVERFHGSKSKEMTLVGLTGTNGKTTTSFFLAQLLKALGAETSVFGTLGVGAPASPRYTGFTTPEAEVLSPELARLHDEGFTHVAMEVSSHALHTKRTDGLKFTVSAFTNLSPEHLDLHGSMEGYFSTKERLFRSFTEDKAVLPSANDEYAERLRDAYPEAVLFGLEASARVRAKNVQSSAGGVAFDLEIDGQSLAVTLDVVGDFNVLNALCAYACALALGFDTSEILKSAHVLGAVPGRMEPVRFAARALVVVDFAHTPDALERALSTLRASCQGSLFVVMGCGGDRDRQKRPLMGAVAERLSDGVVVTNDNPRSESPSEIAQAIEGGFTKLTAAEGLSRGHFVRVLDRGEAIRHAIKSANPNDIILIAGKGHEKTQTFATQTLPFDDVECARSVLEEST